MTRASSTLSGTKSRTRWLALGVYLFTTVVMFACAAPDTLRVHTPYNHFALLAEAWLHGRLDLGHAPPSYTGNNDFAFYQGKWFVVFPPFPALLLLPLVFGAGSAEAVADGRFFLLLAGVAPAALFLVLQELSRARVSQRSSHENVALALLFAFGSVYFFSAVQGTVWFAAHVVAAGLAALYALCALGAERPFLAGLALGLAFATRAPLLLAAPLFLFEALRVCALPRGASKAIVPPLDLARLARLLARFAAPLGLVLLLTVWHNHARFADSFEVGYRYLSIVWAKRIERYGLFDYHYLARNLGVVLTSLPWLTAVEGTSLRINAHGLALWLTTPMYLWLIRLRAVSPLGRALLLSAACVALPTLFYQNTGWVQFGYRFSNDYAVFLFMVLALNGPALRGAFVVASAFAVIVNFFGAITFARAEAQRFYVIERTQRVLYEPD